MAVLAIIFAFHFHRDTGLTSLIRFSGLGPSKLAPELYGVAVYLVPGHHGYDGQYYAHLALHPPWIYHDLRSHFDFPSYRARRVFMPWIAHMLGCGRAAWVVHIYSLLNIVCWLALAVLLTRWLPPVSWTNYARWAGCMLSAGALESLRGSLTDVPSLLLALLALCLWETRRAASSAGVFALSLLTRETMALSAAGLFWPADLRITTLRRATWLGAVALAPIAGWVLYVMHYFPNQDGSAGNFSWPFLAAARGAADAWAHLWHGSSDNGRYLFRLLTLLSMAVQTGTVLAAARTTSAWFRFAIGFILLLPWLGPAVWEGPWAIWRTELPVTIAFCMLAPAGRWFWLLLAVGSLPTLHALFRLAF